MTPDLNAYQSAYMAMRFEPIQAAMRKRKVLEMLLEWKPLHLLEVGCGTDPIFNHYDKHTRCVVVEPGNRFAELARQIAGDDERISVVEATLEAAQAALLRQTFDCILVSGLLHEVPNSLDMLRCVARLCGPGTQVHVNVPNARSFHRLLALEMGLIKNVHDLSGQQKRLQQHHTFDAESLAQLCLDAGFSIVDQGSYFIKPFTHAQMDRLMETGLMSEQMLDGLYQMSRHAPDLGSEIFINLRLAASSQHLNT